MSTLDGREPVVPASGSDAQAPEPTPSDGLFVRKWLTGYWVTSEGEPGYWISTEKDGRTLNLAWFNIHTQQDLATREQLNATARLFAASADLYEALEAIYKWHREAFDKLPCGLGYKLHQLMYDAKDALNKANGIAGSSAPSPEPATAEKKEGN